MRPAKTITITIATLGAATAGLAIALRGRRTSTDRCAASANERVAKLECPPLNVAMRAGRRLHRASSLISGSVLFDSAIEHYRGSFHNKAMFAPLLSSALSLAANFHGNSDTRAASHPARDTIYAAAILIGGVGTGFHIYNVGKKSGGFGFHNLFYSAPIGAPAALILSGMLGFLAERVRDNSPGTPVTIVGLPAGRMVALGTAVGLLGTVGEAGLLHFRGAYHDPFMFLPVTVPPIAAALIGSAAIGNARKRHVPERWWLRLTAAMGFAGTGFHAFGVARNMGGWRNWSQNILSGPPLPAPPAFTGLALAGLVALALMEDEVDE